MRHYSHLSDARRTELFERPPRPFDARDDAHRIGTSLGATLYMPGTRPDLAGDAVTHHARGLVSAVWCLEDSISDDDVPGAEANIAKSLASLSERFGDAGVVRDGLPLLFVRVRSAEQLRRLVDAVLAHGRDAAIALTGFVMPKFTGPAAQGYFDALAAASERAGHRLLAMPVIESPGVVHRETRGALLTGVAEALVPHHDDVACIRIGGTDLGAVLGLRRPRELTIYNIGPVADVVHDIVNTFGRTDGSGYPISGPVWEYFTSSRRLFKPQLRETPFAALKHDDVREELLQDNLDGLVRELALDRANGLVGKTVIHPQHIGIVHALSVVSSEEYADARDVVAKRASGGGVTASSSRNKMNEAGPHFGWAQRTLVRADAYGVAAPGRGMVDFLLAHVEALAEPA